MTHRAQCLFGHFSCSGFNTAGVDSTLGMMLEVSWCHPFTASPNHWTVSQHPPTFFSFWQTYLPTDAIIVVFWMKCFSPPPHCVLFFLSSMRSAHPEPRAHSSCLVLHGTASVRFMDWFWQEVWSKAENFWSKGTKPQQSCIHAFIHLAAVRGWIHLGIRALHCTGWVIEE